MGSVTIILQLLLRLSRFLFKKEYKLPLSLMKRPLYFYALLLLVLPACYHGGGHTLAPERGCVSSHIPLRGVRAPTISILRSPGSPRSYIPRIPCRNSTPYAPAMPHGRTAVRPRRTGGWTGHSGFSFSFSPPPDPAPEWPITAPACRDASDGRKARRSPPFPPASHNT